VVRDEHELHDALLTLIVLPPVDEWREYYEALERAGRATTVNGQWVATERLETARNLPDEAATATVLRGWSDSIGPITPEALAARLSLSREAIDIALMLAGRIAVTGSIFMVGPARARLIADGAVHVDGPP